MKDMTMTLRERLGAAVPGFVPADGAPEDIAGAPTQAYQATKFRIHQLLLGRLDLEAMDGLGADALRDELRQMVERLLFEENLVLNAAERRALVRDIQYEMLGFGPIEPLLADPTVSDILVNTHAQVYVERRGRLELTDVRFADDDHLLKIIDKIVSRIGRRVDEASPMVDARLPDGSRVNAIIPPLAIDGPILSIRRFAAVPLKAENLIEFRSMSAEMARFLAALSQARANILISGGTGSGKTTLLNILSGAIPHSERIVTIEDAAELQLQQPHVVRLETRPPNIEDRGEVAQRALVPRGLDDDGACQHAARRAGAARKHDRDGRRGPAGQGGAGADRLGHRRDRAGQPPVRRHAQADQHPGGHRHGGRHRHPAGDLLVQADRRGVQRRGAGLLQRHRRAPALLGPALRARGRPAADAVHADAGRGLRTEGAPPWTSA